MTYKVRKIYFDFEKEEKWINEMEQKGLHFKRYTFFAYYFEEGIPGEYIYRTELLKELPRHPESKAYIKFMEESGVECVSTYLRWAFFRKKASEGPFDIYSDVSSRISHYVRIAALIGTVGAANILVGIGNFIDWLAIGCKYGFNVNLYASLISLSLGTGLIGFALTYLKKIGQLKKERQIHE